MCGHYPLEDGFQIAMSWVLAGSQCHPTAPESRLVRLGAGGAIPTLDPRGPKPAEDFRDREQQVSRNELDSACEPITVD